MSDLNQYADIIGAVFKQLAILYDDGSGSSGNDVACDIIRILDADTCAEIIEAAKAGKSPW